MVTFLLPPSQALEIVECPTRLAMLRSEKESPRISFSRTSSKSPERVRQRTDCEDKVSRPKSAHRNSWFRAIALSIITGGVVPRSGVSTTTTTNPSHPLDPPTHVHRRTRSLIDSKVFWSRGADDSEDDPRLPDHMRRPELQLRRIQRREVPTLKSDSNRSSSLERTQRHPPWWQA